MDKVWDLFEGGLLLSGKDPEHGVYRGRAHLVEMIALLGPPSQEFLNRRRLKSKFFSESGMYWHIRSQAKNAKAPLRRPVVANWVDVKANGKLESTPYRERPLEN